MGAGLGLGRGDQRGNNWDNCNRITIKKFLKSHESPELCAYKTEVFHDLKAHTAFMTCTLQRPFCCRVPEIVSDGGKQGVRSHTEHPGPLPALYAR